MKCFFKLVVLCALLQSALAVNTEYKGCFYDFSTGYKTLPYPLGTTSDYHDCAEACFIAGYYVSGLQQGHCRCSNGYSSNLGTANISQGTCGTTTSVNVNEVYIVQWGYIGCYTEYTNSSRIMTHYADDFITIDQCIADCASANYPYAGYMTGMGMCYCSNVYNQNHPVPDANCLNTDQLQISVYLSWTLQSAYVGCYLDSIASRDLPYSSGLTNPSLTDCVSYCANNGYAFAGGQYHTECWCGNSYGSIGHATDSNCTFACTGTPIGTAQQYCGGACQNSIYRTAGYIVTAAAYGEANPLPVQKRSHLIEERGVGGTLKNHTCWCGQCEEINSNNPYQISVYYNWTQQNSISCCQPGAMSTCNAACANYCLSHCKGWNPYDNALCATLPGAQSAPCYELACNNA